MAKKKDTGIKILPALLIVGGLYLILRKSENADPKASAGIIRSARLNPESVNVDAAIAYALAESKSYTNLVREKISMTVSTYADMRLNAVGGKAIDFLVLDDEIKGMKKTTYKYFPTGQLMWYASQIE